MKITVTVVLAGVLGIPSPGWSSPRPLELVVVGELPFSRRDLVELVRLRLPVAASGERTRAVVRRLGQDTVEIRVEDRARAVRIEPGAGRDGARLVSLLLLDLVTDVAGHERSTTVVASRGARHAPGSPGEPTLELGLSTAATFMVRDEEVGVEPVIELQLHLARSFWAWLEAGYSWTPELNGLYPDYWVTEMHQVVARVGLAYRLAWLSFHGGAVLRPYWIQGSTEYASFLGGGRGLVLFATAGVDLLFNRDTHEALYDAGYGAYTTELMHTNWAVPWVGLGIGYRGRRR
jgi:hypothetical protein